MPYYGVEDGQIHLNAGLLDGTLVLAADERNVSGWMLHRRVGLCPDYTESLFLRMADDSTVIEQRVQQAEEQVIIRRLFSFE